MSRQNRPAISLARIVRQCKAPERAGKTIVIVGSVTDDKRIFAVPNLKICALRFTESARARIVKAGGTIMTFEQLAIESPLGQGTVLMQGRRKAREANKHFGAPGLPNTHAKPFVREKRLFMSRQNRPAISLARIVRQCKAPERAGKTIVIVGSVTDDKRIFAVPNLKICALRFTESARARIVKAGGTIMTFEQLAIESPLGQGTVLMQGRRKAREANKHFGAPGLPNTHAKPFVREKSRNHEQARGRRKSRNYKA